MNFYLIISAQSIVALTPPVAFDFHLSAKPNHYGEAFAISKKQGYHFCGSLGILLRFIL